MEGLNSKNKNIKGGGFNIEASTLFMKFFFFNKIFSLIFNIQK